MARKPVAFEAYEAIAEAYAARVDTKPHNALYERPATLSLLPEPEGQRVLDAGCGPGSYAEWLVERGAEVVAVDASPAMIEQARRRLGGRAKVEVANLEEGLPALEAESFDGIVSALALHYLRDLERGLAALRRLLRPGGWLVFSIEHPFATAALHVTEDYFAAEEVRYTWRGFGEAVEMPSIRRPLTAWTEGVVQAGFALERLIEPEPTAELRDATPQIFEALRRQPAFLCFRARAVEKG